MRPAADSDIQSVFREYMSLDRERDTSGISGAEEERWEDLKRKLNVHFQPDLESRHADRRGSIRVPTRVELRYESRGSMGESLMTNLSRGGLFITTTSALPIGASVDLHIFVEQGDDEISIEIPGEVTSHHTGTDLYGEQFGMGVRFGHLDDHQRKWVDELYEHSAQRAVGLASDSTD